MVIAEAQLVFALPAGTAAQAPAGAVIAQLGAFEPTLITDLAAAADHCGCRLAVPPQPRQAGLPGAGIATAGAADHHQTAGDIARKSVVEGKSVSVRVSLGGGRFLK